MTEIVKFTHDSAGSEHGRVKSGNPQARVRPEAYNKLADMAEADHRQIIDQLDVIINEAWQRRQEAKK